ncbi:MAG: M23 family metallopeptidase [Acidobacteriota bacterium]
MQLQFHPASRGAAVRTLSLRWRGQRAVVALCAGLAVLSVSLWVTVPSVTRRLLREENHRRALVESRERRGEADAAVRLSAGMRSQARRIGQLLNRIAFLYGIAPEDWPAPLAPEHPVLAGDAPERIAEAMPVYLRALERGRSLLGEKEASDPSLVRDVPAILPLADAVFEPSAYFGPRRSPWTNEEEFLSGLEIASPAGASVVAPGDGAVAFAGAVRRSLGGRLWELGNVVILSHGSRGATVFGHLARIDVRRGERVTRGARLGAVGSSGWALSPQLHYEYWRREGAALRPTDPLFAMLDLPSARGPWSLAQMRSTGAPDPLDPLPGINAGAEAATENRGAGRGVRRRRRL